MSKVTAKCTQCDRVFSNTSQGRLNANMANHMKWHNRQDGKTPESPDKPRKTYTRKAKQTSEVNYCPGCGCNLHAVRVAMSLTR